MQSLTALRAYIIWTIIIIIIIIIMKNRTQGTQVKEH